MTLFRYRQDKIPVLIFSFYFAFDVCVFFLVKSVPFLVVWLLIGIVPKATISAWNHHHQHLNTFRIPLLNRLLEVVYGFQTGMTGNAWFFHHVLGHHRNYLDQEKDEARWKDAQGRKKGLLRYSVEVWLTSYVRAFQVGMRSLKKHSNEFQIFLWMMGIHLLLLAFFMYWNLINAMIVFVVPPAISLFSTCWSTYSHHVGLDTKNPYEASNNVINKWYNFFTGNLGYHTAHHIREGLHWSKLPAFHWEIAPRIPEGNYYNPGFPFAFPTGLSHRLITTKDAIFGKNDLIKLGLPGPE